MFDTLRIIVFLFLIYVIQNKNTMRHISTVILITCISSYCLSQSANNNLCSGTLKIDPITKTVEKKHYIFTGSDTTGLNVMVTKITVAEGRQELVKKRKSIDCDSPNPEDCFTQVLEDIPPVTMNLYTLSGPDKTQEYDIRNEKVIITEREGGNVNENIVCPKNRSPNLIKKVQSALIKLGYPISSNGIYDQATSLSVTDYQRSNGMPYGDLTLGLLAALEVR